MRSKNQLKRGLFGYRISENIPEMNCTFQSKLPQLEVDSRRPIESSMKVQSSSTLSDSLVSKFCNSTVMTSTNTTEDNLLSFSKTIILEGFRSENPIIPVRAQNRETKRTKCIFECKSTKKSFSSTQ